MWFRRKQRRTPMPQRFEELAAYNSRVAQGIVHTEEFTKRMEKLQWDFERWAFNSGVGRSRVNPAYTEIHESGSDLAQAEQDAEAGPEDFG